jgi:hypothetical protein
MVKRWSRSKSLRRIVLLVPVGPNSTTAARRIVTLRKEEYHRALLAARARENSEQYKTENAKRAGIEGTIYLSRRTGF